MAIAFDPAARRIILDSASTSAAELWSRWADWVVLSDNAKYLPAFRQVGGDVLGTVVVPLYLLLINGWRVRPMEADHHLIVDGNLYVDGSDASPFVATLAPWTVTIDRVVPVQAQGIVTSGASGPTAAQIADEVIARLQATPVPVNMVQVRGQAINGAGSEADPWGP